MNREQNLYGTEFEIKLRNEMTQKAIAKECAEWIKRKGVFKSNVTQENMPGFIHTSGKSYAPKEMENSKIHCAREHFKAISSDSVKYDVVHTYEDLMNLIK